MGLFVLCGKKNKCKRDIKSVFFDILWKFHDSVFLGKCQNIGRSVDLVQQAVTFHGWRGERNGGPLQTPLVPSMVVGVALSVVKC